MGFDGMRVLALESRRAAETAELIRRNGGDPFVAPSMREVPVAFNEDAFRFAERLFAGEFDAVIFLTGVGTRYLAKLLAAKHGETAFPGALKRVTTVARGPKPAAALRELGVQPTIYVSEPNTWREILSALEGRSETRFAIQEYGRPSTELQQGLHARGCAVTAVTVYQWDLPEDTAPLEEAVRRLCQGMIDIVLFTSSAQLDHLLLIAERLGLRVQTQTALRNTAIASIGPTTTEHLRGYGLSPALEPGHPKLGMLVKEAAEYCARVRKPA